MPQKVSLPSGGIGTLLLALLGGAVVLAQASQPGSQAPEFRAGTVVIPVNVKVVDKNGKPVTDLKQSDFRVTENKVPQTITQFWSGGWTGQAPTTTETVDETPLPRRSSLATPPAPAAYRVFLIVLGRGNLNGPSDGLQGVLHLVRDLLLPQDRVGVMAWNRATPITTNHEAVAQVIQRLQREQVGIDAKLTNHTKGLVWLYGDREIPELIQRDIDAVFAFSETPTRTMSPIFSQMTTQVDSETLDMVNRLSPQQVIGLKPMDDHGHMFDDFIADRAKTIDDTNALLMAFEYLRQIDGEKHVVWLNEYGLSYNPVRALRMARLATDARVVLNTIRAGGVETPYSEGGGIMAANSLTAAQAGWWVGATQKSTASRTFAEITGGRYDANAFASSSIAAEYIERSSRFEYLLGYTPANTALDGTYRDIRIDVKRGGVTPLYRHGYVATNDLMSFDRRAELSFSRISAAAAYPTAIPDVGLKATAVQQASKDGLREVRVDVRVDPTTLQFDMVDGKETARVNFAAFCLDSHQKATGELWSRIDLTMTKDRQTEVAKAGGTSVTIVVPVKAATASVKLVAYDYYADLIGSLNLVVGK